MGYQLVWPRFAAVAQSAARDVLSGRVKRWLSAPSFSRWTIGVRITAIMLALAVPLNLVVFAVVWHLSKSAREEQRASLYYTARSVAAAVDAKLGEYTHLAQALAASPALLDDKLDMFEAEARRAFPSTSQAWVVVADPEGQELMNLLGRPGQPLPRRSPAAIAAQKRAFETQTIVVTDMLRGAVAKDWIVNIEVPVFKDGHPFRALAVSVRPQVFLRLLNDQQMPAKWLACLTDGEGRFIARVPGQERYVGQLASEAFRKIKDRSGISELLSIEGDPIVTANVHSANSGWPVAIGVKRAVIQAAAWNTIRWAAILAGSLSLLSLLLAGIISRRITGPIAALRQTAPSLLADPASVTPPRGPPEVRDLWEALKQSAASREDSDRALRESEARLRLALDTAKLGVWRWDVATGTDEMQWDSRCKAMFGVPPGTRVTYETWASAIPPEDRVRVEATVARALDPANPSDETACEYRVQHPNGTVRWLSSTGRAYFEPDPASWLERRPVFIAGAIRDVTEVHLAEAALRESEQRLRGIFEHAGTGIAITDLQSRLQSCNPAYAAMLGYREDELRGRVCQSLMHAEDRAANTALRQRLFAGEIPSFEILSRYFTKQGKILWAHRHVSLLKDAAGNTTNVIALVTNMTGQKLHEEHIRLLLREVNHRSKNMLALVQAVARQTLATKPEDFMSLFAERIQALAASQDLLVKNDWKGVDLDELVRSQLAHFKDLIGTRIELVGPPLRVSAPGAQAIGMALHELATNAGKYGALVDGAGHVEIEWRLERAEGEEAFEMSWREQDGPPVAVPSQRGLGSTVICDLAQRSLDAKIDLDFAVTGLRWRLRCRAEDVLEGSHSVRSDGKAQPASTSMPLSTRFRVLVVEDEPFVAMEIAQVLSGAGFDVAGPVGRTAAALDLLKRKACDAAVLDINLGSETSEPVARELIDSGIPFVTLSGYSREQHPPVFKSAPALTKPLRPELLVAELRRYVEPDRGKADRGVAVSAH